MKSSHRTSYNFPMRKHPVFWVILVGVVIGSAYFLFMLVKPSTGRSASVIEWIRHPQDHPEWGVRAGERCTPDAPFVMPTDGLIGYIWDDSFRPGHRHSGLDIFGGTVPGKTPVLAVAPGYLTRDASWKSAVIVRIPSDPLMPSRQIWIYYTHMADPQGSSFISSDFPPGTTEQYIEAGTLLGFQGNYTGDAINPSGVHLHISIVLSGEDGRFLNELEIQNTLDPSPYFGLELNANTASASFPVCTP